MAKSAFVREVVVPVAYDLGGPIDDHEGLRRSAAKVISNVGLDTPALNAFNLSYLGTHAPVVSGSLPEVVVSLGSREWALQRSISIYPGYGIALHILRFHPIDACPLTEASTFHNAFLPWKNKDYFPYLDRAGVMTSVLRERTGYAENYATHHLVSGPIEDLRVAVAPLVNARAAIYPFQDYRVLFVVNPPASDTRCIGKSPMLDDAAAIGLVDSTLECFSSQGLDVLATSTLSVVVDHPVESTVDIHGAITIFGVVHAQWYLCNSGTAWRT